MKQGLAAIGEALTYTGSLDTVLSELDTAIEQNDHVTTMLHAPRIVRGVLDYKLSAGLSHPEVVISDALDTALTSMSGDPGAAHEKVAAFRMLLQERGMLEAPVVQDHPDVASFLYSQPQEIDTAVEALKTKAGEHPVLFVALSHGGVGPGMEVFAKYAQTTTEPADRAGLPSVPYTMRYSVHKRADGDTTVLADSEIKYLQDLAIDRTVVVFDEDVDSGQTIFEAGAYLNSVLSPESGVHLLATADPYGLLQGQEGVA